MSELLQSPTALARALADTQKVVGHDGVLSLFDSLLLSSACIRTQGEMSTPGETHDMGLIPPDEILQTTPLATLLEFDSAPAASFAGQGHDLHHFHRAGIALFSVARYF